MNLWLAGLYALFLPTLQAMEIEKITLPPAEDMQRADLYALKTTWAPQAVLVLCPGVNGSGEGFLEQAEWQNFAQQHQLGLVGLSFASDTAKIHQKGYYYASQGSGQVLLNGIHQIYNQDLPLLMFGFSGGAHFTSGFMEWKPDRLIAWCAYSAGWWNEPLESPSNPPGIIACGDKDPRYGASLTYFKEGRALEKPWLWITVPNTAHSISPAVEMFVRSYFDAILKARIENAISPSSEGVWLDLDQGIPVDSSVTPPSLTGWLPNATLLNPWKSICMP